MPTSVSGFHTKTRTAWTSAVNTIVGDTGASTVIWTDLAGILKALEPFLGPNFAHGHLPTGGGMDFHRVAPARESGFIELSFGERAAYVMKPRALRLEHIAADPAESFLLLELADAAALPVENERAQDVEPHGSQEYVELHDGTRLPRSVWDRGFLRYDANGDEVPLPSDARRVVRWFRGSVLWVVKGSLWNGSQRTYDGVHATMTPAQIRQVIEAGIAHRDSDT